MSDYLSNLVAKTLNRTEVVQPRRTSWFEPPHAASWPTSEHEFGPETGDREPISGEKVASNLSLTRQSVAKELPETGRIKAPNASGQTLKEGLAMSGEYSNKPTEMRSEQSESQSKGQRRHPLPMPAFSQPGKVKFELSSLQPGEASSESTSPQTTRTVVQTSEDRPSSIESTQQQVNPGQPILNTTTYRNQKDTPLIRSAAVPIEPNVSLLWKRGNTDEQESRPVHEPIRSYPEGVIVIQPQVTSYRELARPHPEEPTVMKESTPSIQVTIGRIEVRAIPPPPSKPKKQHPQPSVMSLDEYLHRRARGGKP